MLDLTHVRSFVAIVDSGGFQAAATTLGLAQPTVSQHLRKVEHALGVALVVRNNAHCRPTPQGDRFLPHARRMLDAEHQAVASVDGRRLAVAAASNIGIYMLPAQVRAYAECSGDTAPVLLSIGDNRATLEALRAGRCDIALMEWWPEDEAGLEAAEWRRERLVAIVPPGHVWAGGSVSVAEFARACRSGQETLLGGERGTGTGRLLHSALSLAGCASLETAMELGSTEAVKSAVSAGLGLSIVLEAAVADELRAGTLATCDLQDALLEKPLYCALPAATPDTARAMQLRRILMSGAQDRHQAVTCRDYVS